MYKEKEVILSGIQLRAVQRWEGMLEIIKEKGRINIEDLDAIMFQKFGSTPLTVARYLKTARNRGFVDFEGGNILWLME